MRDHTPTLIDVARKANVSPATISRTLNHPQLVSGTTRATVRAAIDEIGYVVNDSARRLRQQKSHALLVMVPAVSTPFFSQILAGMEQAASNHGYSILIAHTEDAKGNTRNLMNYAHQSKTDGILILGGDEQYNRLLQTTACPLLPIVAVNEKIANSNIPTIAVDGLQAAKKIVKYLVDLGHARIGHVSGPVATAPSAVDRNTGFFQELEKLQQKPAWTFSTQYNVESGVVAANKWIALADKPTAVFCCCDEVAFGFNSHIYRHGFRVPRDVSVVGFDDIPLAEYAVPSLTTIRQPHTQIGKKAVLTLLEKIANPEQKTVSVFLEGQLIIRDSTAPIAQR